MPVIAIDFDAMMVLANAQANQQTLPAYCKQELAGEGLELPTPFGVRRFYSVGDI